MSPSHPACTTTSCTTPIDKTKQKSQFLLESDWLLAFAAMHPDASDGNLQADIRGNYRFACFDHLLRMNDEWCGKILVHVVVGAWCYVNLHVSKLDEVWQNMVPLSHFQNRPMDDGRVERFRCRWSVGLLGIQSCKKKKSSHHSWCRTGGTISSTCGWCRTKTVRRHCWAGSWTVLVPLMISTRPSSLSWIGLKLVINILKWA